MIAFCFLSLWLSMTGWNPYCDCWAVLKPHCYGVPNIYGECSQRDE